MKNKYLLTDAMGSIDDDIILDAKQDNGVKTVSKARATVLKIAIIAATVAIIAACILTAFLSKSATQDEPQQKEYKILCSSDVYDSVGIFPYDLSRPPSVHAGKKDITGSVSRTSVTDSLICSTSGSSSSVYIGS